MRLLNRFTAPAERRAAIAEANAAVAIANETLLREEIRESAYTAQAELALEDLGWQLLSHQASHEFSRPGLERAAELCRIMAVANGLIKHGLSIRIGYIWSGGVSVSARSNAKSLDNPGEQDVNAVLQAWLDDPDTRRQLTGQAARQDLERSLGTDGNLFFALWTTPTTGAVRIRAVPFEEVADILTDPQDRGTPWYYVRRWSETGLDGRTTTMHSKAHPAHDYRPLYRPPTIEWAGQGSIPVAWDAPVLHVKVNGLSGWKWGVGDAYAAIPWARAYKIFLEDWAQLVKALSKYAYRVSTKGSKADKARTAIAKANATTSDTNVYGRSGAGATAMTDPDTTLEAVPKTGATIDSDSGRPLAAMVSAGLDVPVTMLLGDPGQTGARAVAETLDEPTRNAMTLRRELWSDVYRDLGAYVIREAVRAPSGSLRGVLGRDGDRERVALAGDTDPTVEVVWPTYENVSVDVLMKAIQAADQIGKTPHLVIARLVLECLNVDDVDEILEELTDDQGNFLDPNANAGQVAVDAFNRGEDPANALQ